MRRGLLLVLAVAAHAPVAMAGEAARAVVQHLERSMGGREAWQRARYWRFDWVVERDGREAARARHLWDRHAGKYRVEWRTREGQDVRAVFDVATRHGRAWVDGAAVAGADSAAWLEKAYGRFINDSYWLFMPWKLEDPGVRLESAGVQDADGQACDVLHLRFENVGLTPGDRYWAFVDRATGRMLRWAYFLEGMDGEPALERATMWRWSDWRPAGGGVLVACERTSVGGESPRRIHFPVAAVLAEADPRLFESTALPLPEPAPR